MRHDWIEWVLQDWDPPKGVYELIMIPYVDARGLDASPQRAVMFAIMSGVLQGDPLSGTASTLAASPFTASLADQL